MIVPAPVASGIDGSAPAVERFRTLIADRLGLTFEDDKLDWLAELLARRTRASGGMEVHRYLSGLAMSADGEEWTALLPELTVAETYFFRHVEQFHALAERLLPDRAMAVQGRRPLRILSAGCATGEEAYSVAMTVASMPQAGAWDVRIDAIDVNPVVLTRARHAVYRGWSLRETPDTMRQRWFRKEGHDYLLDERIRTMVSFSRGNLADDGDACWQPGTYDIVLCRNVLMYFDAPRMQAALARLTRAMAPEAYLLLGHAESLRGLSSSFRLRHSHGTFYYQLDDATTPRHDADDETGHGSRPPKRDASQWFQSIGESAERVRALADGGQSPRPRVLESASTAHQADPLTPPAPHADAPSAASSELMALFGQERFQEALSLLEHEQPQGESLAPWLSVVYAMLLMHAGRRDDAEAVCHRQLARHPFHADLHHALALCLEAAGQPGEAMESDQAASFLDPAFAMPHVHIGLMARKSGDAETSRRACAMALRLLPRESDERIQLFAGGFSREALRDLCGGNGPTPGGERT